LGANGRWATSQLPPDEPARRAGATILLMTVYAMAAPVFVAAFATRLLFGWNGGHLDDQNAPHCPD
jgi:hypothetical protein